MSLEDWKALQQRRCEDLAWAARFRRACPVPGARDEDYLQKREGELLCGIRFRGGRVDQPFVDLLEGPVDASSLERALQLYAVFGAQRVRVRQLAEPSVPGWEPEVDQWLLAGRPSGGGLELEPVRDLDEAVLFVGEGFAAWAHRLPWFEERVLPITREQLAASQAWWIPCQGQRAGLIAIQRGEERQWSGQIVMEELVLPAFSGRGLAARAQRSLPLEGELLIGWIDGVNAASLRTAEKAGRRREDAFWWVQR